MVPPRFLPATKAAPKEMLPVVDKPLIQYAVEEAYAAGIRHMVFVTGRNKRAIEDHFDTAYELENELQANGKDALLALVRSVQPEDMLCSYVRQPRALGLGHAVLCAEHLTGGQPFATAGSARRPHPARGESLARAGRRTRNCSRGHGRGSAGRSARVRRSSGSG